MRLLYMQALCALVLPMLALRAPAVRALAVHARAVRFRAVRVLCLCSAHLHHAELVDIADSPKKQHEYKGRKQSGKHP